MTTPNIVGRLAGRRIFVVGGGSTHIEDPDAPAGNGRAIAIATSRHGASVALSDIDLPAATKTADLIAAEGHQAHVIQADVADPHACHDMVRSAQTLLGGIDGLVLNVGIGKGKGLEGTSVGQWDETFAVNLRSQFLTLKAAAPLMPWGSSIVLISSVAGLRPGSNVPAYDASKAAQFALMRHAARECAPRGIRVNCIAPGLIDTPLGRMASAGRSDRNAARIPLGRQGTAWEVADAAVFLLSAESSYITAHILVVDGGLSTIGA